jgi:hypothetical protein
MARHFIACLLGSLLLGSSLAWAQTAPATATWKWKDATGQVHVSDTPPPLSVPDKNILERPSAQQRARAVVAPVPTPATAASAAAVPIPGVDPALEARRKKLADDQLAQQRQQQDRANAVRAENCGRAKGQLTALTEGQRMTRTNEKGEREVLGDKERAEEIQRARAVIASDCKP